MPYGSLSLPARLYLLAWDTTKLKVTDAAHLPHIVRAGALTELAQRGLLADVDGIATPTDPDAQTGDPVLDGLLELVEESRPHSWKTWVGLRARVTLDAVRAQLAADGYLRAEKTRVLGVFPSVEYEIDRVAVVDRLREEAREVLEGPGPVEEVPSGTRHSSPSPPGPSCAAAVGQGTAAVQAADRGPGRTQRGDDSRLEEGGPGGAFGGGPGDDDDRGARELMTRERPVSPGS